MANVATNHWRSNWPKTFGFVSPKTFFPRSLGDIKFAVKSAFNVDKPETKRSLKAVGGGWSFTDAALPFLKQSQVDAVSIQKHGASKTRNLSEVFRILGGDTTPQPIDLLPETVDAELQTLSHYDQNATARVTQNFPTVPFGAVGNVGLIDISGLASTLQDDLPSILSPAAQAQVAKGTHYFHVEAGITMADLQQLLDHQRPRLAIRASGGSPGATLAGTLSTATHGGEIQWPLLTDTVRAVHIVGPTGEDWWIEGTIPIADKAQLLKQGLDPSRFIDASWNALVGLTGQDFLDAVIVSMGTMGVIYSVVLEVFPQFGLQQKVSHLGDASVSAPAGASGWDLVLAATGDANIQTKLRSNDAGANLAVLDVILDGTLNGTEISATENLYADLAINPFNKECWITNRKETTDLPVDANNPAVGVGDYLSAVSAAIGAGSSPSVWGTSLGAPVGRIFDFLHLDRNVTAFVGGQEWNPISALVKLVTGFPDLFGPALAALNEAAILNGKSSFLNGFERQTNGVQFLSDCLSGFLNAIQGTADRPVSDKTDLSYRVGAIGWPGSGIPGRALEIAMAPTTAFSFLQTELFDDIFPKLMIDQGKPLIGYISIRVCTGTRTLFGMQQFHPHSVMTEIVGYRSPESDVLMDAIQKRVLDLNVTRPRSAMLHWGLETDQMQESDMLNTPLNAPISSKQPITKIDAFKAIRKYLLKGSPFNPFDNSFTARLGL